MAKLRGMNERIQKLRQISVTTPVHIDLERAKIETDFYRENDGKYSIPVMRAMTLKEYFSKKTLYLGDGELIVGEKGKDPQASPTFPELCCHSEEDMIVMSERDLVSFKTTEEDRKLQREEIIPYWTGRSMREKLLSKMTPEWHDCYEAGMFTEFMEQRGPGHTCGGEQVCSQSSWSREDLDIHAEASRYSQPDTWIIKRKSKRQWMLWIISMIRKLWIKQKS